ncbi:MAG: glycoside hydrolase family 2 TIM barrel-domain containing protein, partial [Candidatus Omnitrophota bacterium]
KTQVIIFAGASTSGKSANIRNLLDLTAGIDNNQRSAYVDLEKQFKAFIANNPDKAKELFIFTRRDNRNYFERSRFVSRFVYQELQRHLPGNMMKWFSPSIISKHTEKIADSGLFEKMLSGMGDNLIAWPDNDPEYAIIKSLVEEYIRANCVAVVTTTSVEGIRRYCGMFGNKAVVVYVNPGFMGAARILENIKDDRKGQNPQKRIDNYLALKAAFESGDLAQELKHSGVALVELFSKKDKDRYIKRDGGERKAGAAVNTMARIERIKAIYNARFGIKLEIDPRMVTAEDIAILEKEITPESLRAKNEKYIAEYSKLEELELTKDHSADPLLVKIWKTITDKKIACCIVLPVAAFGLMGSGFVNSFANANDFVQIDLPFLAGEAVSNSTAVQVQANVTSELAIDNLTAENTVLADDLSFNRPVVVLTEKDAALRPVNITYEDGSYEVYDYIFKHDHMNTKYTNVVNPRYEGNITYYDENGVILDQAFATYMSVTVNQTAPDMDSIPGAKEIVYNINTRKYEGRVLGNGGFWVWNQNYAAWQWESFDEAWASKIEWGSGKVEVFEYSNMPDEDTFVSGYGTYTKSVYQRDNAGELQLVSKGVYDQKQSPNLLLESDTYNTDTGLAVFHDEYAGNVNLAEINQTLSAEGVTFEDRGDGLVNDLNKLIAQLGSEGVESLSMYNSSYYIYEAGVQKVQDVRYFFYDGTNSDPRITVDNSQVNIIYPAESYEVEQKPLDPGYFNSTFLYPEYSRDQKVVVNGTNITIDGNPYIIRGVTYSDVGVGEDRVDLVLDADSARDADFDLMQEAGVNTIRTYYAPLPDFLDECAKHNIRVIVGIPYSDDRTNRGPDIESGTYEAYVEVYKNHPAILMWELGNEYNYHPEWFDGDISNWYDSLEDAAKTIKSLDANHPVATAHGEVPTAEVVTSVPSVDAWGLNIYRYDEPATAIDDFRKVSDKPVYFSEVGTDSYDNKAGVENEAMQADVAVAMWLKIQDKVNSSDCSGVTYMSWQDEWWKGQDPDLHTAEGWGESSSNPGQGVPTDGFANEEYFGWVKVDGTPKEIVNKMKYYWANEINIPVKSIDYSVLKTGPPLDQSLVNPTTTVETSRIVFTHYKVYKPLPQFLPAPETIIYMKGQVSDFKNVTLYYPGNGSSESINLPFLNKYNIYTEQNAITGLIYREPVDVFGRTKLMADADKSEIYLVLKFQDNNIYQPENAVKAVWDYQNKRYNVIEEINTAVDPVNIADINDGALVNNNAYLNDIKDVIAQIKNKAADELSADDLRLVKNNVTVDGETYVEYTIAGDSLGRTVLIDREQTIFVVKSFIGVTDITYEGYFVEKSTGKVIMELKNTDDGDTEYGLATDTNINYYRVRYYNPNTGEVWYRWHYPRHIWGGWAYEERGHFEPADNGEGSEWVAETRLWADEWSAVRDEAVKTRLAYIDNGSELLKYNIEITGTKQVKEIISAEMEAAYNAQFNSSLWKDMAKIGITPGTKVTELKKTPVLWNGNSVDGIQASQTVGQDIYFYTLPSDPLGRELLIKTPDSADDYKVTLNAWWMDNSAPLGALPASITLDPQDNVVVKTFDSQVSDLSWYDLSTQTVTNSSIRDLTYQQYGAAYVYNVENSDFQVLLDKEIRLPSSKLIQEVNDYLKIRALNRLPLTEDSEVVQYRIELSYQEPQVAFNAATGDWTKKWISIQYNNNTRSEVIHTIQEKEALYAAKSATATRAYDQYTKEHYQKEIVKDAVAEFIGAKELIIVSAVSVVLFFAALIGLGRYARNEGSKRSVTNKAAFAKDAKSSSKNTVSRAAEINGIFNGLVNETERTAAGLDRSRIAADVEAAEKGLPVDYDLKDLAGLDRYQAILKGFEKWLNDVRSRDLKAVLKGADLSLTEFLVITEAVFSLAKEFRYANPSVVYYHLEKALDMAGNNKRENIVAEIRSDIEALREFLNSGYPKKQGGANAANPVKEYTVLFEDIEDRFNGTADNNIDFISDWDNLAGKGKEEKISYLKNKSLGLKTYKDEPGMLNLFRNCWPVVVPLVPAVIAVICMPLIVPGVAGMIIALAAASLGLVIVIAQDRKYDNMGSLEKIKEINNFYLFFAALLAVFVIWNFNAVSFAYPVIANLVASSNIVLVGLGAIILPVVYAFVILSIWAIAPAIMTLFAYYEGKKNGVGRIKSWKEAFAHVAEAKGEFKDFLPAALEDRADQIWDNLVDAFVERLLVYNKIPAYSAAVLSKMLKGLAVAQEAKDKLFAEGIGDDETQERVKRFVAAWLMSMPKALAWEELQSLTAVITCFDEQVITDFATLNESKDGIVALNWFISKNALDWLNFAYANRNTFGVILRRHYEDYVEHNNLNQPLDIADLDNAALEKIVEWAGMHFIRPDRSIAEVNEIYEAYKFWASQAFP